VYFVFENARASHRQHEADMDFKFITNALRNFDAGTLQLPYPTRHAVDGFANNPIDDPTAKPLYSWRLNVIVFLCSYADPQFDQAWDSSANANCRQYGFDFMRSNHGSQSTQVFAITGPDTPFGDGASEKPHAMSELDNDTILIVEVRNAGVHWMEPGDFDIRTMPHTINAADGRGISGEHAGGFFVGFADGEVWFIGNDVPFDELAKFFTIAGAKANDRDAVLRPYKLN
jgi:hypothetical protein